MPCNGKNELTKRALAQSLKKHLAKKPLNRISIRELVEDCGFNRQTFYYHFQDIYSLLEWMLDQEIVSVFREDENFLSWQDAGLHLLHYIQKNEAISLCILHSVGRDSLKQLLYKDAYNVSIKFLMEKCQGLDASEQNYKTLAHYYSISFAALLEDWVTNGLKTSPDEVLRTLELIVTGTARQAMERLIMDK